MKKLLGLLLAGMALTTACKKDDFLEPKASALTEETVFADSTRTFAFLTRIYADMGFSFTKGRWSSHGNTEQATDDAEYNYSGSGQLAVVLYSGTYTPLNFPFTEFYDLPWANIRRVNLLLSKLPTTPLSQRTRDRLALEARFLRAYYYEQLLVCFGGMPII
ncbi:MAG: RagB/SusD family nutrient uptake outer membrane protein, partial [Hymenobacter sp.]